MIPMQRSSLEEASFSGFRTRSKLPILSGYTKISLVFGLCKQTVLFICTLVHFLVGLLQCFEMCIQSEKGGDCSMEYLAITQDPADGERYTQTQIDQTKDAVIRGRVGYENLGALRTKPGRLSASYVSKLLMGYYRPG